MNYTRFRWAGIAYELSRCVGHTRYTSAKTALAAFDIAHELEDNRPKSKKKLLRWASGNIE